MKAIVVCICNNYHRISNTTSSLTIGKQYQVEETGVDKMTSDTLYAIVNDDGYRFYYNSDIFASVEEYRNDKLNELGI